MDRGLTIFIWIWVALNLIAHLLGIAGTFLQHGFGQTITYIQETYSPFNLANHFVTLVFLSPAFIAYYWREKRRARGAG